VANQKLKQVDLNSFIIKSLLTNLIRGTKANGN